MQARTKDGRIVYLTTPADKSAWCARFAWLVDDVVGTDGPDEPQDTVGGRVCKAWPGCAFLCLLLCVCMPYQGSAGVARSSHACSLAARSADGDLRDQLADCCTRRSCRAATGAT